MMHGFRSPVGAFSLVFLCGLLLACDGPASPVATTERPALAAQLAAVRSLSGEQRERIENAKRASQWVADAHHRIVMQATSRKKELDSLSVTGRCEALVAMLADELRKLPRSQALTTADVRRKMSGRMRTDSRCAGLQALSLFPALPITSPFLTAARSTPSFDEPTQAGVDFAQAVADAVDTSDGTPSGVALAVDAALATGIGLNEADFQMGATVAALAISSVADWHAYAMPGGGGGYTEEYWSGYMTSLFPASDTDLVDK